MKTKNKKSNKEKSFVKNAGAEIENPGKGSSNFRLVSENYKLGKEKFVTNKSGKIESVLLPVEKYNKLMEIIEDYGLGLAMNEAENEEFMNRDKALKYLENNES